MQTASKKKPSEKVTLHIPMDRDLAKTIDKIAERENRSRTNVVLTMVKRALAEPQQQAM